MPVQRSDLRVTALLNAILLILPAAGFGQAKTAPAAEALDSELKAAIKSAPAASQFPNNDSARILDLADVTVKPDGTVIGRYRETIKVFNERGRHAAEVSLPYNSSYQSLTVTSARTIKKDGRILPVKSTDIRATSSFSDYPMYDDSMTVGFSMPGVEDDCIIDYSWKTVTRPLLMPGHFWEDWYFSGMEPVSLSRYRLTIASGKRIHYKIHNDSTLKPAITTSPDGKSQVYVWEARGLKPIELEPAMPDQREIRVWLDVTTLESWQQIAGWYWNLAKNQFTPGENVRKTVATLTAGKVDDSAKAAAIYDWVANRVRYVGLEFGLSAYKPHPAPEVHEKLYGDCKDKATLLIAMLKLAGIKASPVLLRAEEKGDSSEELPGLSAFNHCIALAEVGGKPVWLDATAETCPYGDIPDSDRGVRGYVIRDGQGRFETIPQYTPDENGFISSTKVSLQPDGSASLQIETRMTGATAQQWRSYARSISPEQRKQAVQGMAQAFAVGGTLKDYKLPDGQEKKDPFTIALNVSAPSRARRIGSLLIVPVANGGSGDRTNPFVKDKRIWPIVVEDATMQRGETLVAVPEGYVIEEVPDNADLVTPLFEYHTTYTKAADGKTVTVVTTSISRPGKAPATDYAKVRAHYDNVLRAREDAIVLRRIKQG